MTTQTFKWRFIVVNIIDGLVKGTNNQDLATELSGCEDSFVIDVQESTWLMSDDRVEDIPEELPYVPKEEDNKHF